MNADAPLRSIKSRNHFLWAFAEAMMTGKKEYKSLVELLPMDLRVFVPKDLSAEAVRRFRRIGITNVAKLYDALYLTTGVDLPGIGATCISDGQMLMRKLGLDKRIGLQDMYLAVATEAAVAFAGEYQKVADDLKKVHDANLGELNGELNALLADVSGFKQRESLMWRKLQEAMSCTLNFKAPEVTPDLVKMWLLKRLANDDHEEITFGAEMSLLVPGFGPFIRSTHMTLSSRVMAEIVMGHEQQRGKEWRDHTVVGFHMPDFPVVPKEVFATFKFGNGSPFSSCSLHGSFSFGDFSDDDMQKLFESVPAFKHPLSTNA